MNNRDVIKLLRMNNTELENVGGTAVYIIKANHEMIAELTDEITDVITAEIIIEGEDTIIKEYLEETKDADFQTLADDIWYNIFEKVDDWENKDLYITFMNKGKNLWGFNHGDVDFYPCDCGRGMIYGGAHMCSVCWDEMS